jgi:pyochelin synthetase
VSEWPLFSVEATRLSSTDYHVHFSIDLLIADARSAGVFLQSLADLYFKRKTVTPPSVTFRDYVIAEKVFEDTHLLYKRSKDYWMSRVDSIPPSPQLPMLPRSPTERYSPNDTLKVIF